MGEDLLLYRFRVLAVGKIGGFFRDVLILPFCGEFISREMLGLFVVVNIDLLRHRMPFIIIIIFIFFKLLYGLVNEVF